MSAGRTILVLDADGVFLSERPYWNAALGAALDLAGLSPAVNGGWDRTGRRRLRTAGTAADGQDPGL